jgi:formate hydrogenlyase subunit 6/NADH:ubiquinone oxidoreductase subunit I
VQEISGEPGNFQVKVSQKPRYIDVTKCTGCGDCGRVTLSEDNPPREINGLLWVDRVKIDETKCIHCGDCVTACLMENPDMQGMTNIVRARLQAASAPEGEEGRAPLLMEMGEIFDRLTLLQRLFRMSHEERKAFWNAEFKKCIKCYGCVDVCPVYEDRSDNFDLSKEIPLGQTPPPYPLFHFLRGYNVWDTCVVCGECEKTCPSLIPLKTFQDMVALLPPDQVFDLVPGLDPADKEKILAFVEKRRGKLNVAA